MQNYYPLRFDSETFKELANVKYLLSPSLSAVSSIKQLQITLPDIYFNYDKLLKSGFHQYFTVECTIKIRTQNNKEENYIFNLILSEFTQTNIVWQLKVDNIVDRFSVFEPIDNKIVSELQYINYNGLTHIKEKTHDALIKFYSSPLNLLHDNYLYLLHIITCLDIEYLNNLFIFSENNDIKIKDEIILKINSFLDINLKFKNYVENFQRYKFKDYEHLKSSDDNFNTYWWIHNRLMFASFKQDNNLFFQKYIDEIYSKNSRNLFAQGTSKFENFKNEVLSYLHTPLNLRIKHYAYICSNSFNYNVINNENIVFKPLFPRLKWEKFYFMPQIYHKNSDIQNITKDFYYNSYNDYKIYKKLYSYLSIRSFTQIETPEKFLELDKECQSILSNGQIKPLDLYIELRTKNCIKILSTVLVHNKHNYNKSPSEKVEKIRNQYLKALLREYKIPYSMLRNEKYKNYEKCFKNCCKK